MKYIDFHTHTVYSDGISLPEELVKAERLGGIDVFAKTDHDTVEGYEEARQAAQNWGLGIITGAEFSAAKYHILGLGFDIRNQELLSLLARSRTMQRENTRQRAEILAGFGVPISIQKIEHYFPRARIGKYNLFMTLIRDEECRDYLFSKHPGISLSEINEYYLGKHGVASKIADDKNAGSEEIIRCIHQGGGIAIPAHLPKDIDSVQELDMLREQGADGFEIQPNFYKDGYGAIEDYARRNHLFLTYGSDFHGANFNRPLLGRGMNKLSPQLEERLFPHGLEIRDRLERICA